MNPEASSPPASLAERVFEGSKVLRSIAEGVDRGGVVTIGRAADSVGALLLAYLTRYHGKSILAVAASLDEASRLRGDFSQFLGEEVEEFPPWESLFEADSEPDPETFRQRYGLIDRLASNQRVSVVAPLQALLQPIARDTERRDRRIVLREGESFPPETLARALVDAGYRRFPQVARPGDFSIRGGIFDVFPREAQHPYRIDFFGDEVDSIRTFSVESQRSLGETSLLVLTLLARSEYFIRGFTGKEVTLFDRLPPDVILAVVHPQQVIERAQTLIGQWAGSRARAAADEFWARVARQTRLDLEPLVPEKGKDPFSMPVSTADRFQGSLEHVMESLDAEARKNRPIRIFLPQLAEVERFREILAEHEVSDQVQPVVGEISRGFQWDEDPGGIFLSGSSLLGRMRSLDRRTRKSVPTRAVESFVDLQEDDLVVHVGHGIGRFKGIREVERGRRRGDHLVIEYREGVQLLVPAERIDLVQKYIGVGKANPPLDRLGSKSWASRKARVEESVQDLAADMIELQALRSEREGLVFPPDNEWQREFEAAFPFEETGDQLLAIEAVRKDLESSKPMDRLVCGDVGYGKTEIAMRAAFKVVQAGKQVAVVVPTTVLAQQHYVTFRDRMAEFPVRIDTLSRLKSRREQSETLELAHQGEIDILIGTHRLFSSDVSFADIGLIIIDEEQRFGVAHKERLKQLRRLVDILTLTATPIPRTLHMALIGVKDISSLDEAPQGRSPIHTEVCTFDPVRFREIMLRELNRDGQIFYVHNRVHSIKARRQELEELVPEARMIEVHGQMDEHELEARMLAFIRKEYDVLVSTTIIESGLDIPSANTLIVERADRFGLAEMHQLRGRVGRGLHQAYAYFVVPDDRPVKGDSLARLRSIEEYSQLGAGFQIAMRDLEIRGAGNILGKEQSGHIAVVGYDMYCRLLERAVAQLQGVARKDPPDVEIAIPGARRLPADYVTDQTQRLRLYRSIATALDAGSLEEIREGMVDSHGALPTEVEELLQQQALRIRLASHGVIKASLEDGWLMLEGDFDVIERGFRGEGWEVLRPPGRAVAARPRGSRGRLAAMTDVMGGFRW